MTVITEPVPAIDVLRVSHRFPRRSTWALRDVSFRVYPGQWIAIVGANEAGKSTLIRILATLLIPKRGQARIHGRDIIRHPSHVRRLLGVALDGERTFYYRLTVSQNLEFFAGLYGLYGRKLKERVEQVLEWLDLRHVRHERFSVLSTGMRKRMALARALMVEVPVYLLDEPTAHLDASHAWTVRSLLNTLHHQGKTLLTTAHRDDGIKGYVDSVLYLQHGALRGNL